MIIPIIGASFLFLKRCGISSERQRQNVAARSFALTINAITYEFVSYILPITTKSKQMLHF